MVLIRWMNVVAPKRPGVVEATERSSQSIAVGSTLTPLTRAPTTFAAVLGLPGEVGSPRACRALLRPDFNRSKDLDCAPSKV